MKKENGFIAITVIYSFFLLFVLVMILVLYTHVSDRKNSKSITNDIKTQFEVINPHASFSQNGSDTPNSSYSVIVVVSKGSYEISSNKYVWSTDKNANPTTSFASGNTLNSPTTAGKYYLIIKTCDVYNNCEIAKSRPFIVGS